MVSFLCLPLSQPTSDHCTARQSPSAAHAGLGRLPMPQEPPAGESLGRGGRRQHPRNLEVLPLAYLFSALPRHHTNCTAVSFTPSGKLEQGPGPQLAERQSKPHMDCRFAHLHRSGGLWPPSGAGVPRVTSLLLVCRKGPPQKLCCSCTRHLSPIVSFAKPLHQCGSVWTVQHSGGVVAGRKREL